MAGSICHTVDIIGHSTTGDKLVQSAGIPLSGFIDLLRLGTDRINGRIISDLIVGSDAGIGRGQISDRERGTRDPVSLRTTYTTGRSVQAVGIRIDICFDEYNKYIIGAVGTIRIP